MYRTPSENGYSSHIPFSTTRHTPFRFLINASTFFPEGEK